MHDSGYGVHTGKVTASAVFRWRRVQRRRRSNSNTVRAAKAHTSLEATGIPNLVYVFDAAYCAVNGLGVALSDGVAFNEWSRCVSKMLQLPGVQSHWFSLDSTEWLATCVATGHLITWSNRLLA
jgi:hypothetical protein